MRELFSIDHSRLSALEASRSATIGVLNEARRRLECAQYDLRRARMDLEQAQRSGRRVPLELGEAVSAAQRRVEIAQAECDAASEQRSAAGRLAESAKAYVSRRMK